MPTLLEPILPFVPSFMLVLFRLAGLFIFAPLFGSNLVPIRVRTFLAIALSFCVFPMVPTQAPPLTLFTLPVVIASEMFIGMLIGYGASLPLIAVQVSGMMMGHQIGLGLARVFSPDTQQETEVLSEVFFLVALIVFLLLNGHHAVLGALVRSFHSVPLGGFRPDGQVLQVVTGMLGSMFDLAICLAAPLLCLIFLETVTMGFIARTVPQLNILTLGFPLRVILGLFLLVAVVGVMYTAVADAINEALATLLRMFAP